MKYKFFIFILGFVSYSNNAFAGATNKCVTYSCGCCCTQDTKPCCNSGVRPPNFRIVPNSTITNLSRTYNTKNIAARSSAITVTESDITTLMSAGNAQQTFFTQFDTDNATMDIGVADATNAQTWTIPNDAINQLIYPKRLDFIAESEVPSSVLSLYGAGTVSHWAKETITREGVTYTGYQAMWLNTGSHIDLVGKVHVRDSDGVVFENTGISGNVTNVNMTLADNLFNYSAYAEPNNTNFNNYSYSSMTIDGYGTITTPYGTFDCLRASFATESQLFDNTTGFSVGDSEMSYWVAWLTKEGFRFYGRKPAETSSGSVVLKNMQMQRILPSVVLPVELLHFSAKNIDNQQVKIEWETASEKNNVRFEVQKATDGKTFETIATVKGKVNSTEKQSYSVLDETPSVGHNYYRLRQIDTDGSEAFSRVEYVWIQSEKGFLNLYPNPAKTTLTVECEKATEMVIINTLGQVVKTIQMQDVENFQKYNISIMDIADGMYFLKATLNGEVKTVQFVKN